MAGIKPLLLRTNQAAKENSEPRMNAVVATASGVFGGKQLSYTVAAVGTVSSAPEGCPLEVRPVSFAFAVSVDWLIERRGQDDRPPATHGYPFNNCQIGADANIRLDATNNASIREKLHLSSKTRAFFY
jgi:hypothetical protein